MQCAGEQQEGKHAVHEQAIEIDAAYQGLDGPCPGDFGAGLSAEPARQARVKYDRPGEMASANV